MEVAGRDDPTPSDADDLDVGHHERTTGYRRLSLVLILGYDKFRVDRLMEGDPYGQQFHRGASRPGEVLTDCRTALEAEPPVSREGQFHDGVDVVQIRQFRRRSSGDAVEKPLHHPRGASFLDHVGDGLSTDAVQGMIRRYIAWRNRHTTDPKLRKVIKRASTITRAKVA
jgi:hypothetical protein